MTTTYPAAMEEMFDLVIATWNAGSPSIVGDDAPDLYFPMVVEPVEPDIRKYWARVSTQMVSNDQSTLRNGNFGQRFTARGLLFLQIFAPKVDAQARTRVAQLCELMKNAFTGHNANATIWYLNPRINEVAQNTTDNTKFYQQNVVVEYRYDEVN